MVSCFRPMREDARGGRRGTSHDNRERQAERIEWAASRVFGPEDFVVARAWFGMWLEVVRSSSRYVALSTPTQEGSGRWVVGS